MSDEGRIESIMLTYGKNPDGTYTRKRSVFDEMVDRANDAMNVIQRYIERERTKFLEENPGAIITNTKLEENEGQFRIVFEGLKPRDE